MAAGLKVGDVLKGRYPIQSIIGEGGMGAVYKASDLNTKRTWAVKEMTDSFDDPGDKADAMASFHTEMGILSQLDHPNLPRITDYFSENGRQYLVMDLVPGDTLEKVLKIKSRLSLGDSLDIALQLTDVLGYLHTRPTPVIFRDLKPANIIITPQGTVKLIDFGIARFFSKNKTADTRAMGTPGYAAPEQYGGRGQTDARADIYALGATLHECLTGIDPSYEPFKFAPLNSVIPDVSDTLQQIITKACSIDQNQRFNSVSEFRKALENLRNEPVTFAKLPEKLRTGVLPCPKPVVFAPGQVDFGKWDSSKVLKATVVMQGKVKGTIQASDPWIQVKPGYVNGTDVPLEVLVDTNKLSGGGLFSGFVKYGTENLNVKVEVIPSKFGCWTMPLVLILTMLSLTPILGMVPCIICWFILFLSPSNKKGILIPFIVTSTIFSLTGSVVGLWGGNWFITQVLPWLDELSDSIISVPSIIEQNTSPSPNPGNSPSPAAFLYFLKSCFTFITHF